MPLPTMPAAEARTEVGEADAGVAPEQLLGRELVDPLLERLLVFADGQRELGHATSEATNLTVAER